MPTEFNLKVNYGRANLED